MTALAPAPAPVRSPHARLGQAGLLVLAAALFALYPALRPYSSETGLDGAEAFASWAWTASHLCGIVAFAVLAQVVGGLGLGRVGPALVSWGALLVLPYYGAEVFGVGAVGRRALDAGDPGLVGLVDDIRYAGPPRSGSSPWACCCSPRAGWRSP